MALNIRRQQPEYIVFEQPVPVVCIGANGVNYDGAAYEIDNAVSEVYVVAWDHEVGAPYVAWWDLNNVYSARQ